jgi:ferredoxin
MREKPRGTKRVASANRELCSDLRAKRRRQCSDFMSFQISIFPSYCRRAGNCHSACPQAPRRVRRACGRPFNLAQQARGKAAQSVLIWLCIAGRREHYRFRISDANALRTSDCEIPNCRAILDGVTPALKAARTAFNFPCVKGTAATASMPSLRETAASCFPRRFCSTMTVDSNWSSSRSLSCLTAFGKSAGRTWREGIALGGTGDSEDREGASPMGADANRSGVDERARVPMRRSCYC